MELQGCTHGMDSKIKAYLHCLCKLIFPIHLVYDNDTMYFLFGKNIQ